MPERRYDPLRGHSTWIAAARAGRPHDFREGRDAATSRRECPFCEGNEARTTPEVAALRPEGGAENGPGWAVRVVTNLYPAVTDDDPPATLRPDETYSRAPGYGRHEVLIETTDHDAHPADYTVAHATDVLAVLRGRVEALSSVDELKHVIAFQNFGRMSGASLRHPHQQIVALPDSPPSFERGDPRVARAQLEAELKGGARVVARDDRLTCLVPFCPRVVGEVHLVPRGDAPPFRELDAEWIAALARWRCEALRRVRRAFDDPDYNLILHAYDRARDAGAGPRWRLEILPRRAMLGGFELATSGYIVSMAPEDAAAALRAAEATTDS